MRGRLGAIVGVCAGAIAAASAMGALVDQVRNPTSGTFYERFGKRACDIAVGLAALPVVGAVTAACGAAIRVEDGGPVFYNAPRVGKGGSEFTMYKLRSMKVDAPDLVMDDGSTYNGADDPRMTRVGAFMRKTSLDEIPQFLNVLKGDMSVVGPRPDLKRETELYQGEEARKLTVKPGVTGYAAVYGRNSLPWHDRLALDVYYVDHLSFALDAKVFARTFATVFAQEGIYVEDAEEAAPVVEAAQAAAKPMPATTPSDMLANVKAALGDGEDGELPLDGDDLRSEGGNVARLRQCLQPAG